MTDGDVSSCILTLNCLVLAWDDLHLVPLILSQEIIVLLIV
jgi:hypothetical protein